MATRYKKIVMVASFSVATSESAGKVLYTMDGRSADWRGWQFEVRDGLLLVTPPNRYATTEIPLVHVKTLLRECEALPDKEAKPRGRPAADQAAA